MRHKNKYLDPPPLVPSGQINFGLLRNSFFSLLSDYRHYSFYIFPKQYSKRLFFLFFIFFIAELSSITQLCIKLISNLIKWLIHKAYKQINQYNLWPIKHIITHITYKNTPIIPIFIPIYEYDILDFSTGHSVPISIFSSVGDEDLGDVSLQYTSQLRLYTFQIKFYKKFFNIKVIFKN